MNDPSWDAPQTAIARQIWISGTVQGVGFRATAQKQAQVLGLSGWVRNWPDGRVEIQCCGPADRVETLIEWCHRGAPGAKVAQVTTTERVGRDLPDPFEIRPTPR